MPPPSALERNHHRSSSSSSSRSHSSSKASSNYTISELLSQPSTRKRSNNNLSEHSSSNHRRHHQHDEKPDEKFVYPEKRKPRIASNPVTAPISPSQQHLTNKHYIFVYGTLKRGFANSYLLERSTYIGDYRTVIRYPLVDGGKYKKPQLLDVPNTGNRVKGEVFAIDDACLADLDHLENVGLRNSRKVIKVSNIADRSVVLDAYVYIKANDMGILTDRKFIEDYQAGQSAPRQLR